jgi:hypothetical protein
MFDEVKLGMKREVYKGKYSMKFNRITGKQGNKLTGGLAGCNSRRAWKESRRPVGGYILIADASSLLRFRKHRIKWIILAPIPTCSHSY